MEQKHNRWFNSLAIFTLGWLLSRFLLSLGRIQGEVFYLLPGFLLLTGFVFYSIYHVLIKDSWPSSLMPLTVFCAGIFSDALAFWISRTGSGAPVEITSAWAPGLFKLSFCMGLAVLILLLPIILKNQKEHSQPFTIKHFVIFISVVVMVIVLFRVVYLMTLDIPNEERSFMIMGHEIHHAYQGFLFFFLWQGCVLSGWLKNHTVIAIGYGLIMAFIGDQILYLQMADVSDQAYNSVVSWSSALCSIGILGYYGVIKKKDSH